MLGVLCVLALTLSCTKETQGGDHGSQGGGTQTSLELTEFTRLNRGESEINSHADDWDRSTVKMDYRSYIELGRPTMFICRPMRGSGPCATEAIF